MSKSCETLSSINNDKRLHFLETFLETAEFVLSDDDFDRVMTETKIVLFIEENAKGVDSI